MIRIPCSPMVATIVFSLCSGVALAQGGYVPGARPRLSVPLVPPGTFIAAIDSINDQDGDGVRDILVGTPDAYGLGLVSGATLQILQRNSGPIGSSLGATVAAIGDIDGNGREEIAVRDFNQNRILVYSYRGGLRLVRAIPVSSLIGTVSSYGNSITRVGDLTGDGIEEIAVGDDSASASATVAQAGLVEIIDLAPPAPAIGPVVLRVLRGVAPRDLLGTSLANLGDIDMDGISDFAIGARQEIAGGLGYVQVISGASITAAGPVVQLAVLNGNLVGDQFGWSLANIGDVTGDGIADLAVGTRANGTPRGNYVSVFSGFKLGRAGGFGVVPEYVSLPRDSGAQTSFGYSLSGTGDVNGDGVPDLMVGTPYVSSVQPGELGTVTILSGADGSYAQFPSSGSVTQGFGFVVSELDGASRLILDRVTGELHLYR